MGYFEETINKKKILLVGDLILDRFYYGEVNRISPEAPVPVFLEKSKMISLGGAGNVASNLVAAKQQVTIMSVIGKDEAGEELKKLLKQLNVDCTYLIKEDNRITSVKNRFLGENKQQLLRHDYERVQDLTEENMLYFIEAVEQSIEHFDLMVISDYGKGVCSGTLINHFTQICKKHRVPVICDVKGMDATKYIGAFLIKPNLKELKQLTGLSVETDEKIIQAASILCKQCDAKYILVTCGANGMVLIDKDGEHTKIEGHQCEVYDVTGAGDTVLAFICMGMANHLDMKMTIQLANCAGELQVQKSGTVAITLEEVIKRYLQVNSSCSKQMDHKDIEKIREIYRDKKIVFTNGCFDIFHAGHAMNLKKASELGDILIVAINSDESVRRIKGESRPVNVLADRMAVIAALESVDYVTWFDEDTPYNLIRRLKPDIIVKGEDYQNKEVVGSDILAEYGGQVVLLPFLPRRSTTEIINKIIQST